MMRDEDFEVFIEDFGEATSCVAAPPETIERYRGKLPDQLLHYWATEGWCAYADGLLWTVDPGDYEEIVDAWLQDTPFQASDRFHAIARSAFGDLYLCGENTGPQLDLLAPLHSLLALKHELRPKTAEELDFEIRCFFGGRDTTEGDLTDEHGDPLFKRALEKFGPLGPDDVYAFEPALILGGRPILESLQKVEIQPHLAILRQLAPPRLPFLDIDPDQLSD